MTYLEDPAFLAWLDIRDDLPRSARVPMWEAYKAGRDQGRRDVVEKLERCARTGKSWPEPVVTTEELSASAEQLRNACAAIGITDPREAEFSLRETEDGRTELVARRREHHEAR